jgi:hypothetical protein
MPSSKYLSIGRAATDPDVDSESTDESGVVGDTRITILAPKES